MPLSAVESAPSRHVFVDESMTRDEFLMAAVAADGPALDETRRILASVTLPGQRRLHMRTESDRRRRQIVSAILAARIRATLYTSSSPARPAERRARCLQALARDLLQADKNTLVTIETDESELRRDQRVLANSLANQPTPPVAYRHRRAYEEPLLALPDVIAWCWRRGDEWRNSIAPLVSPRDIWTATCR